MQPAATTIRHKPSRRRKPPDRPHRLIAQPRNLDITIKQPPRDVLIPAADLLQPAQTLHHRFAETLALSVGEGVFAGFEGTAGEVEFAFGGV